MKTVNINTVGATEFAESSRSSTSDITINWFEVLFNYRIKKWKRALKTLCYQKNMSMEDVCKYMGIEASSYPGFYRKLPKKRETYIAIGMAFKQPIEVINVWLTKYGAKRKLYAKDVITDLIWIYLINANFQDTVSNINYFREYDTCKSKIKGAYNGTLKAFPADDVDTVLLEENLKEIAYGPEHGKLKEFVRDNMEVFATAYAKARKYLKNYVGCIIESLNKSETKKRAYTLNSLRGYLDDSMINYLSGAENTMSIAGNAEGHPILERKYVPKMKRFHISLCLALGMSVEEINEYLDSMGYFVLDGTNSEEGQIINLVSKWDKEHSLQRKYKDRYFKGNTEVQLSVGEEIKAVEEMLAMATDIKLIYRKEIQDNYGNNSFAWNRKENKYLND